MTTLLLLGMLMGHALSDVLAPLGDPLPGNVLGQPGDDFGPPPFVGIDEYLKRDTTGSVDPLGQPGNIFGQPGDDFGSPPFVGGDEYLKRDTTGSVDPLGQPGNIFGQPGDDFGSPPFVGGDEYLKRDTTGSVDPLGQPGNIFGQPGDDFGSPPFVGGDEYLKRDTTGTVVKRETRDVILGLNKREKTSGGPVAGCTAGEVFQSEACSRFFLMCNAAGQWEGFQCEDPDAVHLRDDVCGSRDEDPACSTDVTDVAGVRSQVTECFDRFAQIDRPGASPMETYRGAQDTTETGKPCLVWSDGSAHYSWIGEWIMANPEVDWNDNKCRAVHHQRPWCYTKFVHGASYEGITWENCDVKDC